MDQTSRQFTLKGILLYVAAMGVGMGLINYPENTPDGEDALLAAVWLTGIWLCFATVSFGIGFCINGRLGGWIAVRIVSVVTAAFVVWVILSRV